MWQNNYKRKKFPIFEDRNSTLYIFSKQPIQAKYSSVIWLVQNRVAYQTFRNLPVNNPGHFIWNPGCAYKNMCKLVKLIRTINK